jgi:hypothetical protein
MFFSNSSRGEVLASPRLRHLGTWTSPRCPSPPCTLTGELAKLCYWITAGRGARSGKPYQHRMKGVLWDEGTPSGYRSRLQLTPSEIPFLTSVVSCTCASSPISNAKYSNRVNRVVDFWSNKYVYLNIESQSLLA